MIYNLYIRPNAKKDIEKLDKAIQKQILKKLNDLKLNPNLGKPLSNIFKHYKKIRISKYRILYFIKEDSVVIVRIGHRKNIYSSDIVSFKSPINEKIVVVNNLDEIISYKDRIYLSKKDYYRSSLLVIKNKNNQFLLAKRIFKKGNFITKYSPSVEGFCEKDEDYVDCILRESYEKLNLVFSETEIKLIGKILIENKEVKCFTSLFLVVVNDVDLKETKINNVEIKRMEWFDKKKLKKEILENKNDFLQLYI
jgi:mRNA interferase RelE/StbE